MLSVIQMEFIYLRNYSTLQRKFVHTIPVVIYRECMVNSLNGCYKAYSNDESMIARTSEELYWEAVRELTFNSAAYYV